MSVNPHVRPGIHCAGPNCEAVRKEANHWFLITFIAATLDGAEPAFYCRGMVTDDIQPEEMPACGQQCAQKLFEQYLNNRIGR